MGIITLMGKTATAALTIKAAHPAIQVPYAALQAKITAGIPAPAVTVPNINPAAV